MFGQDGGRINPISGRHVQEGRQEGMSAEGLCVCAHVVHVNNKRTKEKAHYLKRADESPS